MSKIEEAINSLHEAFMKVRPDGTFLSELENTLDVHNKLLYKGNMITTEGANFGKSLLQNERFTDIQEKINRLLSLAGELSLDTTLAFNAKLAEYISNTHYALLISSDSPEKEQLSQLVLDEYTVAIQIIAISEQTLRFYRDDRSELSEEAAQIASKHLIPLLHLRARILSGAYDPDLRNDEKFNQDVEWIKILDSACIETLNRPPHMSLAIIERTQFKNIARHSTDTQALEACVHSIEEHNAKYKTVYREDGLTKEWATDPFNLGFTEEIKGRCLLKLKKFREAYDAFENMGTYSKEVGNVVRAGWAEFCMAKVAKNSRDQSILSPGPNDLPDQLTSKDHILDLLEKAKIKESKSRTKTWARDEIEEMIQVMMSEPTFEQRREVMVNRYNQVKEASVSTDTDIKEAARPPSSPKIKE